MKEKALVFEPYTGFIAGAQKVTHNVIDILKTKYDVTLILRNSKSPNVDELKLKSKYKHIPFEFFLSKVFGRGSSDSRSNGLAIKVGMLFLMAVLNVYVFINVLIYRPSLVYTYDPRGLILSGLLLKLLNTKLVWHLHGPINFGKTMNKILLSSPDIILVPSNYIKESINSGSYDSKIKVIYNGFKIDLVDKDKSTEFFEMLYVGTIVPHKGLHNILIALKGFKNSAITLNILGEYHGEYKIEYKIYIESLLAELPKNIKVNFLGWVSEPNKYYAKSSLLLFSSVIDGVINFNDFDLPIRSSEALPTVLIEALAQGTPVVATNTPGVSEIVTSKRYGVVIDESEPDLLYEAINKVMNNYNQYNFSGEDVAKKFSLPLMTFRLKSIL
ncbi:TPA: glycosyltransferase family 4 protein [Vibrio parahaemolyticus]|nr:glycosyltransferase family 4 protein [Vibrio antiquarius]MCR9932081.1 glycosyltransferase family 4 protein [Vibrio antiquarius]